VLRDLARIAQRQVRLGEEIFRVGGEEFAIVIEASPEVGVLVADRVRGALAENRRSRLLPTLSAGVAGYPQDAGSKESLLAAADDALYAAKRGGRDAVALYSAAGAAAQMIER